MALEQLLACGERQRQSRGRRGEQLDASAAALRSANASLRGRQAIRVGRRTFAAAELMLR